MNASSDDDAAHGEKKLFTFYEIFIFSIHRIDWNRKDIVHSLIWFVITDITVNNGDRCWC